MCSGFPTSPMTGKVGVQELGSVDRSITLGPLVRTVGQVDIECKKKSPKARRGHSAGVDYADNRAWESAFPPPNYNHIIV